MALAAGARLGSYEILSALGSGGMGEVYRARDAKLDREVAIKVLPAEFSRDSDRLRRFEHEARAAAALNHPNIITIFSVEEADGTRFLAMELVDGKSLAASIPKGGMALDRLLGIAIQLTDAMSAAHHVGITHRDLKPANVMIASDGRVKVLDFGLAKRTPVSPLDVAQLSAAPTKTQTVEGSIVGTVAYMSPEQAEGKAVDQRSDVFSLGIILYEMATGERPFTGNTSISVLSSIVKDTPRLVTDVKPELPRELSRIIRRCLMKDPEYRFQTAKDLRNDLIELKQERDSGESQVAVDGRGRRAGGGRTARQQPVRIVAVAAVAVLVVAVLVAWMWFGRGSPASGAIDSLAVLPFVNIGGDPNTEYLSDGITENLINGFSQLRKLRVVPRARVFHYKGRESEPEKVGRELNVLAVLTGRIVQRGTDLIVQVDLVDVTNDSQLWGRQYTTRFSEIITLQDDIATAVAEKLGLSPTREERKRLTKRYTENADAHQLYLKGRYLWNRRTPATVRHAEQYFQQAIERDPGYALAWAGLSDCYGVYAIYGVLSNRDSIPRAKEAAGKALELDDTLAEAHASLGYADGYEWDWSGAEREFQRAIALDPGYPTAHHWRATNYLEPMGRLEEAYAEFQRAQELDPLSLVISATMARTLIFARHYDRAAQQLSKTLEIDSSFALAHLYVGLMDEQTGKIEHAIAEFKEWQHLSGDDPAATGALGHAYAVLGRRSEARQALARLQELSQTRYVAPYDVAVVYMGLGDTDSAMEWLKRAYEDHSAWLIWLKLDHRFESIRNDARYRELLHGMNIPE
jgi:TolB-like protein/tetratricopeptide (TPR) repeat protein